MGETCVCLAWLTNTGNGAVCDGSPFRYKSLKNEISAAAYYSNHGKYSFGSAIFEYSRIFEQFVSTLQISTIVNKLKLGKVISICFVLLICTGNFGANMTSSLHNLGLPCVKAVTHVLKTDTFPKSRCTTHLMHKQFWHKIHDEEEIFIFARSATATTPAHTVQLGRCK